MDVKKKEFIIMVKGKEPTKIYTEIELKNYLIKKGENHKSYNHYTISRSLNSILKNETLKLTRGNLSELNDNHEFKAKGKEDVWNRTYIFCFSYGNNENMAMLGLYGLPSKEAVRFSFNEESINILKNINKIKIYSNDKFQYELEKSSIEDIFITDVFYIKDESVNNQKHRGEKLSFPNNNINSLITSDKATGLVKNYVWHQESEVRLIIRFQNEQRDITGELLKYIYLKFPEDILEKIQIMLGPNFDENYINRVYDIDSINNKKYKEEFNNKNFLKTIESINDRITKKNETIKNCKNKLKLIIPKVSKFKGLIHFKSDNFVQVKNNNSINRG